MTTQQYDKFLSLIKAIENTCKKYQAKFEAEYMRVKIADKHKNSIVINIKKYKDKANSFYIRCLMISALKILETKKKQLDFDNRCDLTIKFMPRKFKQEKNKKNYKNKRGHNDNNRRTKIF